MDFLKSVELVDRLSALTDEVLYNVQSIKEIVDSIEFIKKSKSSVSFKFHTKKIYVKKEERLSQILRCIDEADTILEQIRYIEKEGLDIINQFDSYEHNNLSNIDKIFLEQHFQAIDFNKSNFTELVASVIEQLDDMIKTCNKMKNNIFKQ